MRFLAPFLAAAGLVAGLAAADPDTKYDINWKKDVAGQKVLVTKTDTGVVNAAFTLMGREKANAERFAEKQKYTEEIIEKPAGAKKATKLRRAYEVAERTKNGKRNVSAYAGKTVLIAKGADGKYTFTMDGEELDPDDAKDLDKEFNKKDKTPVSNDDFLPGKPVKLNEPWKVNAAKLAKGFAEDTPLDPDPDQSTATGRLTKVYQKDGRQFGVVEIKVDLVPREFKLGGEAIQLKKGSKITLAVAIDAAIDGSTHDGTLTMKAKMAIEGDIPNGALKLTLDATDTETHQETPAK